MNKVITNNVEQANNVINSFQGKEDLTVVLKDREVGQIVMKAEIDVEEVTDLIKKLVKENTATENSNVSKTKITKLNSDGTVRTRAVTLKGAVTMQMSST